jgi:Na+/proline symporter
MKFFKLQIKGRNLFYSKQESWWLIGFSMILAGGILTEPQILTSFLLEGDLSGMWLVWTALIGVAFGKAFFAHLWHRLPVKTENELILFRFSGKGARWLHIFRSVYVGGIVVPLMLSMAFLAFGRVLAEITGINIRLAIAIILLYILIGTFFNSLRQRLRFDFAYFLLFILSLAVILVSLNKNLGSLADISHAVNSSNINFSLFPQRGTEGFSAFLVFVLLQWWSANIIDLPSMTGQKLMAAQSQQTIVKSIILPQILFSIFFIAISTIPFYVLLVNPKVMEGASGEGAFLKIFTTSIASPVKWVVLLFFLMPFTAITQNSQNWSGSLLVQNLYKHHIRPQASEKQLQRTGMLVMMFVAIVASVIAMLNNSILDVVKYILTITAGVDPVYILRWYWHRINGWTQLTAQVVSLIYPTLYDLAYKYITSFSNSINWAMETINIGYFPLKIVLLTIAVCATWIAVMLLTKPTDKKTLSQFVSTLKPGGWWNIKESGKVNFGKRFTTALLMMSSSVLNFVVLWKLVSGEYAAALLLFVLCIFLLILSYYLLKRINTNHG